MDPVEGSQYIFGTITAEAGILASVLFLLLCFSLWANYKQWDWRNKADSKVYEILSSFETTLTLILDRQAR